MVMDKEHRAHRSNYSGRQLEEIGLLWLPEDNWLWRDHVGLFTRALGAYHPSPQVSSIPRAPAPLGCAMRRQPGLTT